MSLISTPPVAIQTLAHVLCEHIAEKSSPSQKQDDFKTLAEAEQGFKKVWDQCGKPDQEFPLWSKDWSKEELKTRFDQFEAQRSALYVANPQELDEKKGVPLIRLEPFALPEEESKVEEEKYGYPVSFGYNRVSSSYNASIIHIQGLRFIAMEAPMADTLKDFFHVLENYNVSSLVRLTPKEEDNELQCFPYWEELAFDMLQKEKDMVHAATEGWPDGKGFPPDELFSLVLKARQGKAEGDSITAVHCAAGMGRTGTFIAAYVLAHDIDEQLKRASDINLIRISIEKVVWELSMQRAFAVSELDQYLSLYNFVQYYLDYKQHHS